MYARLMLNKRSDTDNEALCSVRFDSVLRRETSPDQRQFRPRLASCNDDKSSSCRCNSDNIMTLVLPYL